MNARKKPKQPDLLSILFDRQKSVKSKKSTFAIINISLFILILLSTLTFLKPFLSTGGSYFGYHFSLIYLKDLLAGVLLGLIVHSLILREIGNSSLIDFSKTSKVTSTSTSVFVALLLIAKGREFWNCFYFVPDSAGWLADPQKMNTFRPGLMRWFYERFITQEDISFAFYDDKSTIYNQAICNPSHEFLFPIRMQICLYLISLFILIFSFKKLMSNRHLLLLTLFIISGYTGTGEFTYGNFDRFTCVLLGIILAIDVRIRYRNRNSRDWQDDFVRSVALFCFYVFFIPISFFNFIIPEINSVQSEALAYSLLNLSISCLIFAWLSKESNSKYSLFLVPLGLFFAGLLATARLSTVGTVFSMFAVSIFIILNSKPRALVALLSILLFISPILLIQNSSYKPNSSMTFWGPIAYALYSIDVGKAEVNLTPKEDAFVYEAIKLANEAFERYTNENKTSRPMWPNLGVYLYYGAHPAAQELGIGLDDPKELEHLFRGVFTKTIMQSPSNFLSYYYENFKIALGLYEAKLVPPVSQFNSRIFYGPLSLLGLLIGLIVLSKKAGIRTLVPSLMLTSIYASGMMAAVFFDGPSRRNLASNDLYLIPVIILFWVIAGEFLEHKVYRNLKINSRM